MVPGVQVDIIQYTDVSACGSLSSFLSPMSVHLRFSLRVWLICKCPEKIIAGVPPPAPWLFESAKRPDDTADYCWDCSFRPLCKQVLVFTLVWSGANSGEGSAPRAFPANLAT